jgi:hypothetical protein
MQSPLEASVQELCNARLVEDLHTLTKTAHPFLPAISFCGLLPGGLLQILIRRPSPAETIPATGLRSPSITEMKRKYAMGS